MLDLGETLADSTPLSPLIFVLSAGVDPTQILRKLALERGMGSKFFTVALGQGQVSAAVCQALLYTIEIQALELALTFACSYHGHNYINSSVKWCIHGPSSETLVAGEVGMTRE